MSRVWTCRSCRVTHSRLTQKCVCGQRRPAPRRPKHMAALDASYEAYVELNGGEHCGICGTVQRTNEKRLHRDHDHRTATPRGLLCFRCNSALRPYMTLEWLRAAVAYLERTNASETRIDTGSTTV